jgi:hypothetical protein
VPVGENSLPLADWNSMNRKAADLFPPDDGAHISANVVGYLLP